MEAGDPSARKRPGLGNFAEAGLDRIHLDIVASIGEMPLVADLAVEIFAIPEEPAAPEHPVDPAGCKGLPGMDERGERMLGERCRENMHMVRHNTPGMQAAALTI